MKTRLVYYSMCLLVLSTLGSAFAFGAGSISDNVISNDRRSVEAMGFQSPVQIVQDLVRSPIRIYQSTNTTQFISKWDSTNPGSSNSNQIMLPLLSSGTYNFTVDWGDGTTDTITSGTQAERIHTYSSPGVYTVIINGTIDGFAFNYGGDVRKILDISQWGTLKLGNSGGYFYGADSLKITATDVLDLTGTTDLTNMFRESNISSTGNLNSWDVSSVTSMHSMFQGARNFNQPLNNWNTSSVTDMAFMFAQASSFNQSLDFWDVSSVTDMGAMFQGASSFNQPLNNWDISNNFYINYMFDGASAFNQPLDLWDVSSIITTDFTFRNALAFDQPLGSWNVSSVVSMTDMLVNTRLSVSNYDDLLVGWSGYNLQSGVIFNAGGARYSVADSRQYIIDTYGWTIIDGGEVTYLQAPSNLQVSLFSDGVFISWEAPPTGGGDPISEYRVYRTTPSRVTTLWLGSTLSLNFTDSTVENGMTYIYYVNALNASGFSPNSNEANVTIPSIAPNAPQNLQVSQNGLNVTLAWNAPTSDGGATITEYRIYRSITNGSGYTYIGNSSSLTYSDFSVMRGNTYYYVVRAVNSIGESVDSDVVGVTVPAIAPSAPENLQASMNSDSISLTWNASVSDGGATITGYRIYRSTTSGSGYTLLGTSSSLSYTDSTVEEGMTYYYIVRAINSAGESVASNEVSISIPVKTSEVSSTSVVTTSEISSSPTTSKQSSVYFPLTLLLIFSFIVWKRKKVNI